MACYRDNSTFSYFTGILILRQILSLIVLEQVSDLQIDWLSDSIEFNPSWEEITAWLTYKLLALLWKWEVFVQDTQKCSALNPVGNGTNENYNPHPLVVFLQEINFNITLLSMLMSV
jgi:hypothetical protein